MAKDDNQAAQPKQNAPKRPLTWQEKLDQSKKLSPLDEVKADADFNHQKRVRDEEEREKFEARKRGERQPSEGSDEE